MNLDETQGMKAIREEIPEAKRREIEKKNRQGLVFMSGGLGLIVATVVFMFLTMTLNMPVIFLILIGVFLAMYGSHMYSGQYSKAAGEWAAGIVKRLGGFRK